MASGANRHQLCVSVCQCAQQNRTATEPSFTLYVIYSHVLLKTNCLCEHLKINGLHWIFTMFVVFLLQTSIPVGKKRADYTDLVPRPSAFYDIALQITDFEIF